MWGAVLGRGLSRLWLRMRGPVISISMAWHGRKFVDWDEMGWDGMMAYGQEAQGDRSHELGDSDRARHDGGLAVPRRSSLSTGIEADGQLMYSGVESQL
jgi:hypothetical protein